MNVRTKLAAILAALTVGGVVCLGGCATMERAQAERTTNKINTVEGDMKDAVLQVDATNTSLKTLIQPDQMDVKKAYEDYKANVSKMDNLAKKIDKHDQQMQAQGKEYFSEWEKKGNTYTDPQLRNASEERRAELSDKFSKIPEASAGARESLHSYMAELKQIQNYIANDMTPQGVEAMRPAAEKAIDHGDNVKDSIKPVISAMDNAMSDMAQGRGAAAGGSQ